VAKRPRISLALNAGWLLTRMPRRFRGSQYTIAARQGRTFPASRQKRENLV